jgi:hypothetical protein
MENAISMAYRRGTELDVMPIPPIPEHCIEVPAGPVTFVVESRDVGADLTLQGRPPASGADALPLLSDAGASLHVVDAATGLERLRFDCFDNEPHYHYVKHEAASNHIVRIDEIAEGDPVAWTIGRMRDRLPEMLEYAGAPDAAAAVRADAGEVAAAVERLSGLLDQARDGGLRQPVH